MRCLKDHHTVEKTVCPILVVASFYEHIGKQILRHTCFAAKDKVEIIVLGGTWSHYPRDYQDLGCVSAMSMLLDLQNQ